MIRWIEDQVLRFLQRRCNHPDNMVATDILEGLGYRSDIEVAYCRRCGAVRPQITGSATPQRLQFTWRMPDPNLWRGK